MATLVITRGLPGCGKTTRARAWVAEDPAHRVRVNRDDCRTMMHGGRLGTEAQERQVTAAEQAAVAAVLTQGWDVIADDTSLPDAAVARWADLAAQCGATLEIWDMRPGQPDGVPLETCIARDAARVEDEQVGKDVIREMWAEQGRVRVQQEPAARPAAGTTAVILDRIEPGGYTPPYCVHGRTTCVGGCGEWLWLGDQTHAAVVSGRAAPICAPCARRLAPNGAHRTGRLDDHRSDLTKGDQP
jgi:predicted kinase